MNEPQTPSKSAPTAIDQAIRQAIDHHKNGLLQDAERLYRAILQAEPNHPDANHNLGVLAIQVNQVAAALPHLKAALEANPAQGQYWLSYIEALAQTGQTALARDALAQGRRHGLQGAAIEALEDRLARLDGSPPGHPSDLETALSHREAGTYKEAIALLQRWLDGNPQDASAHALLAQVLSLDGQNESAWAALTRALSINPTLPVVQRNRARLLMARQEPQEALRAAQSAYRSDTQDAENRLVLALALGAGGRPGEAFAALDSALRSRPSYAEAFATKALFKLRGNDLAGALRDAERALSIKPHLAQMWRVAGLLRFQKKDFAVAAGALEKALAQQPDDVDLMVNLAECRRRTGAPEAAIASDHSDAWVTLGAALQQAGRIAEAKAAYARALEITPERPEIANNLGALAKRDANWDDALGYIDQALLCEPSRTSFLTNRAAALTALKRYVAAERAARRAIRVEPSHQEAHVALAGALIGQRDYDSAQSLLDAMAIASSASPERSHYLAQTYASLFHAQARWPDAEAWVRRALAIKPDCAGDLNTLAALLNDQGKSAMAMPIIKRSLAIEETSDAKSLFVAIVKHVRWTEDDSVMVRAVTESWAPPGELVGAGTELITLNAAIGKCVARAAEAWPARLPAKDLFGSNGVAAAAADPLLIPLLNGTPLCNTEMERFLTMARHALLEVASQEPSAPEDADPAIRFYSALANQSFINEYVWPCTEQEIAAANRLRDSVVDGLRAGRDLPALPLLAVGTYFPLGSLPSAERLLDKRWPDAVAAVLRQQIREPAEEMALRETIPRLTAIEDEVSLLVQNQYEENPYPRWVTAGTKKKHGNIVAYLGEMFPLTVRGPSDASGGMEILIAGCGTGHHSVGTAQRFPEATILAVDLSIRSLAYAKRKTRELGLTNIDYAQADLLALGSLGRTFDVIESVGVLHHLADPMAGWRVLLSLLRPGGYMVLGFYSEIARRNIVKARDFVAEQGYKATATDIRQCRQTLIALKGLSELADPMKLGDFFSTSSCRDLLFHVQEHRMRLADIDAFLRENNLTFLGFNIQSDVLRSYQRRFPDDPAATNLDHWQTFESENPDSFLAMYQFWIQKTT